MQIYTYIHSDTLDFVAVLRRRCPRNIPIELLVIFVPFDGVQLFTLVVGLLVAVQMIVMLVGRLCIWVLVVVVV